MKSTGQHLFSLHQRRCVKCQRLHEVRTGQQTCISYFRLLCMHEDNMMLLYGLLTLHEWLERSSMDLPPDPRDRTLMV